MTQLLNANRTGRIRPKPTCDRSYDMIPIHKPSDIAILSESVDLECKLALGKDGKGALPKDFWKTYSAFANTRGGVVLLGVREIKGGGFSTVGIKNIETIRKNLFNTLNNPNKVSINLISDRQVTVLELAGKRILAIEVPRAPRKKRPVFLNGNPLGNTYRRFNGGDHLCDGEATRRMLAEQVEDERDGRLLTGYRLDDLTPASIQTYRQMLSSHKPDHPWNELPLIYFLRNIQAWRINRETGEEGPTLGGLLMFGQQPAIQEALPHYFLDYQERPATRSEPRWLDRLTLDGTWSGNLFDFYRRVYRKLTADLKVPFIVKEGRRQGDTPVHIALREALINTLVHADFSGRVSLLVVKQPTLFGFRNPGNMRIPIEQALRGGESDCRNQLIHQMFLLIGLGERAGSGIPKIYSGWKSEQWRPPVLYEKREPDQTLLTLRMLDLLPPEIMQNLEKRFGDPFQRLTGTEQIILAAAHIESGVDHQRLVSIFGDQPLDLSMILQKLVKEKFLQTNDDGSETIHHLPGDHPPSEEDVFNGEKSNSEHYAPESSGHKPQKDAEPIDSKEATNSPDIPGSSEHFTPGSSEHFTPESSEHFTPESSGHKPQKDAKPIDSKEATNTSDIPESSEHYPPESSEHYPPESSEHYPPESSEHYPLTSTVHKPLENSEAIDSTEVVPNSAGIPGKPGHQAAAGSERNDLKNGTLEPSIGSKTIDRPLIDTLSDLDRTLRNELRSLAAPVAKSKRCRAELVKKTILTICAGHFVTLKALEELLNRKRDSLRIHYLNPMVENERTLRRAHPEKPNDPRQAYTAIDETGWDDATGKEG